jgi:hypothetical protein
MVSVLDQEIGQIIPIKPINIRKVLDSHKREDIVTKLPMEMLPMIKKYKMLRTPKMISLLITDLELQLIGQKQLSHKREDK